MIRTGRDRGLRPFLCALLAAALLLSLAAPAQALEVPPNRGDWVTDNARLLSPQEKNALGAELRRFAEATGNQIVVLTIDSLEGEDAPGYANKVARAWGVGRKDKNNGVLILVARREARVRFEVGRGVEDRLTDVVSKRIQREVTVPHFRAGRFGQGLAETVAVMERLLAPDEGEVGQNATAPGEPAAQPVPQERPQQGLSGTAMLTLGLAAVAAFLGLGLLWRRFGDGDASGGYRSGNGSPFLLGFILGIISSLFRGGPRGPFGGGGYGGGMGGGDGGFSGGSGDFGGGGSDSGFGGGDDS